MKRTAGRKETAEDSHVCGECALGSWIMEDWNLDIDERKPICLRCGFSRRARIRNEKACVNFKSKRNVKTK